MDLSETVEMDESFHNESLIFKDENDNNENSEIKLSDENENKSDSNSVYFSSRKSQIIENISNTNFNLIYKENKIDDFFIDIHGINTIKKNIDEGINEPIIIQSQYSRTMSNKISVIINFDYDSYVPAAPLIVHNSFYNKKIQFEKGSRFRIIEESNDKIKKLVYLGVEIEINNIKENEKFNIPEISNFLEIIKILNNSGNLFEIYEIIKKIQNNKNSIPENMLITYYDQLIIKIAKLTLNTKVDFIKLLKNRIFNDNQNFQKEFLKLISEFINEYLRLTQFKKNNLRTIKSIKIIKNKLNLDLDIENNKQITKNQNSNSSFVSKFLNSEINLNDLLNIINKKFVRNAPGPKITSTSNYSYSEDLILYMMKNFITKVYFNKLVLNSQIKTQNKKINPNKNLEILNEYLPEQLIMETEKRI